MSKSGFLKGLIFKEDGAPNSDDQGKMSLVSKNAKVPGEPVQSFTSTQTVQGIVDNKFVDVLTAVLEENNQPGQDYFEFKQAIENMKSMAMTDQQKFQTVYAVLGLQGCTKTILITSLDKYIGLIQEEKKSFDKEMNSQFQSKVQNKMVEVDSAKQELESLTKRMTELNTKILTLQQEAGAEEMKLRAQEANFQASADVIINEMLGDKQKINNFIQ